MKTARLLGLAAGAIAAGWQISPTNSPAAVGIAAGLTVFFAALFVAAWIDLVKDIGE